MLVRSESAGADGDGLNAVEDKRYILEDVEELGIDEVSSARSAATPKSPSRTVPSLSMSRLAAFMSR